MDEETIMRSVVYLLSQYAVAAADTDAQIIRQGPDAVAVLMRVGADLYFVVADDYLMDDAHYQSQASALGLGSLTKLRLLSPTIDGAYDGMLLQMMARVYKVN